MTAPRFQRTKEPFEEIHNTGLGRFNATNKALWNFSRNISTAKDDTLKKETLLGKMPKRILTEHF